MWPEDRLLHLSPQQAGAGLLSGRPHPHLSGLTGNRPSWGPTLSQDVSEGPGGGAGAAGGRWACQDPHFLLWASWITGAARLLCGWRGPGSSQSALVVSSGRSLIPSTWGGVWLPLGSGLGLPSGFPGCVALSVGTGWAWAPPCSWAPHRPACPHPHTHTLPTGPVVFLPLAL